MTQQGIVDEVYGNGYVYKQNVHVLLGVGKVRNCGKLFVE